MILSVFQTNKPQVFIAEIGDIIGSTIQSGDTLLFVDEIQALPESISALRCFYEDIPDLAVIAAGFLLEFDPADYTLPMPWGRGPCLHMGLLFFLVFLDTEAPYCSGTLHSLSAENAL